MIVLLSPADNVQNNLVLNILSGTSSEYRSRFDLPFRLGLVCFQTFCQSISRRHFRYTVNSTCSDIQQGKVGEKEKSLILATAQNPLFKIGLP